MMNIFRLWTMTLHPRTDVAVRDEILPTILRLVLLLRELTKTVEQVVVKENPQGNGRLTMIPLQHHLVRDQV